MKSDAQIISKIEKYLAGRLSTEDAINFEMEIRSDPELEETVAFYRLEQEALEAMAMQRFREKIKSWESSPPPVPASTSMQRQPNAFLRWLFIILGLMAVFSAIVYFFREKVNPTNPDPKTLQKEVPNPEPNVPVAETPSFDERAPKQTNNTKNPEIITPKNDQRFAQLALNFSRKNKNDWSSTLRSDGTDDFAEAKKHMTTEPQRSILILEKLLQSADATTAAHARTMLGYAHFENKNFRAAAAIFQIEMQYGNDRDRAQWQYLLCLVAEYSNQKRAADAIFFDIFSQEFPDDPDNNHPFFQDAKRLKSQIEALEK